MLKAEPYSVQIVSGAGVHELAVVSGGKRRVLVSASSESAFADKLIRRYTAPARKRAAKKARPKR